MKKTEATILFLSEERLRAIFVECVNAWYNHQQQNTSKPYAADEILSIDAAAAFVKLSAKTLYRKRNDPDFPVSKPPGTKQLLFLKSDLIAWVKSGRKKTSAEIEAESEQYLTNKKRKLEK